MSLEPLEEGVEHKASGLRSIVLFAEMRESSFIESLRATLSINVLIAKAAYDLGKIGL